MTDRHPAHVTFFVPGIPGPQGSKRAFVIAGKARLVEMSKRVKPWRKAVYESAREALILSQKLSINGPISVHLDFVMPRPKRPTKPACDTKPDLDKLVRSTLDGLTGMLFNDDSAVVELSASKRYARDGQIVESPGCFVSARAVPQGAAA